MFFIELGFGINPQTFERFAIHHLSMLVRLSPEDTLICMLVFMLLEISLLTLSMGVWLNSPLFMNPILFFSRQY